MDPIDRYLDALDRDDCARAGVPYPPDVRRDRDEEQWRYDREGALDIGYLGNVNGLGCDADVR